MRRGDIVVVALQGDSGKPRPALIVQADWFDALSTIVVLPLTGSLRDASLTRISIASTEATGLFAPSQIAIDRPQTIRREKIGKVIGRADDATMLEVNRALAVFIGLG
ncbi:MAG TPA: type II toxin-antitoxin system PemK/MazF family toxin [Acetobacteraceae bacterium]|nr:type II toxin-antitoxin system PemK/MazF family toxin [Acetobacteraceae bacterium]